MLALLCPVSFHSLICNLPQHFSRVDISAWGSVLFCHGWALPLLSLPESILLEPRRFPPPQWCWTACKPGGRRGRRRRLRLRLKAQVLQLVICALNWECLGHPKVAPDNARIGAPVSESQLRVVDLLESQIEHLLRVPASVADDLGRAAGKFSSFREVVEELPSERVGTVDLLDWATAVHDSLLPYKSLRPRGPDQDLASRQDEDVCAPKQFINFRSGGPLPVVADRIKWKYGPTFDPSPYLDPLTRAAFHEPALLRKPPEQWPRLPPAKVH